MVKHILLAVDDTPASQKVAEYLGGVLRVDPKGRRTTDQIRVTILHCYPSKPQSQYAQSKILASAAAGDDAYQEQLKRSADIASSMLQQRRPPDAAREQLVELGVPRDAINVEHVQYGADTDVAAQIVATARRLGCDTIAVGRNPDGRILRKHVSDVVLKHAQGLAVLVVQ